MLMAYFLDDDSTHHVYSFGVDKWQIHGVQGNVYHDVQNVSAYDDKKRFRDCVVWVLEVVESCGGNGRPRNLFLK